MLRSTLRRLDDEIRQCEARVEWQDARAAAQWEELHRAGRRRLKSLALGGVVTAASGLALRRYSRRRAASRPGGRAPWWHHLLGPAFLPLMASAAAPLVGRKGATFLAGLGLPFHVKEPEPLELVAELDPSLLAGQWYEIARLPAHPAREVASDVTLEYLWHDDGSLEVVERGRRGDGSEHVAHFAARLAPGAVTLAQLELTGAPFWLRWWPGSWADHWVLDLSGDGQALMVGTPERDRLWILARTPALDESGYQAFVARAAAQGFDVQRLVRTAHEPRKVAQAHVEAAAPQAQSQEAAMTFAVPEREGRSAARPGL